MRNTLVKLDRNKNLVSYSRNLAEARYYLSPLEQKLVWAMCSLVNSKDDEDFKTYKVEVSSLADYIGIDKKSALRELDRITDNLMSRVLRIPIDKGDKLLKLHWVSHCLMSDKCVEFSFHPKMKPYLLKLRKQFASHRYNTIVSFRGSYTIRLYQLLKTYHYEGSYKCTVDKLREILDVGDAYKQFKEFKRNVLMTAKKEFERKNKKAGGYMSDITFDLETLRTGRRITDLVFHIKKQSYQESLPLELPPVITQGDTNARTALESYGIKGKIAQKYLGEQKEDEILRCVAILEQAKLKGNVKSESGYLLKLLESRAGEKTTAEIQAEEKEKEENVAKANQRKKAMLAEEQEKLAKEFRKKEVDRFLGGLSAQEKETLLTQAKQENPLLSRSVNSLKSPILFGFLLPKIPNFENNKQAYIKEKMKGQTALIK